MSGREYDPDGTDSYHPQHPWEQTSHPLYISPDLRTKKNWPPAYAIPMGDYERQQWENLPPGRSADEAFIEANVRLARLARDMRAALVSADSIMSLIRYRESTSLSEQTIADLDRAIGEARYLIEQTKSQED